MRGQTPGQASRTPVPECLAACGGGTLPRAQVPHLSSARGGLGRRRDPGSPQPADLGAELQAGSCRRGPSTAPLGRPGERGRSPPRGGARGGARGVPSGPASGLCLPAPRASGTRRPTGRLRPPHSARPASGQLTWAPRRRLPRSAPPARLGSARLGPVRLSTGGAARASARARRRLGLRADWPRTRRGARVPAAASAARAGSRGDLSSGGAEARLGGEEEAAGGRKRGRARPRRGAQAASLGVGLSSCQLLHAALFLSVEKFPGGDGGKPRSRLAVPSLDFGATPIMGKPFPKPPPHRPLLQARPKMHHSLRTAQ